jgi:hypothetical protein
MSKQIINNVGVSMSKLTIFNFIVVFLLLTNCNTTNEKNKSESVKQNIGFEIGQKVYVNSASGLIVRKAPAKSSPKIDFLHYGVPVTITNINYQEDLVDGKYKGYWLQQENGGWFFSFFVSSTPNEKNIKAVFNHLLSELKEFKNLDEDNIELSGDSYRYYYDTQSHIHPEFKSISFKGNESVEYVLETWSGFGTHEESIQLNQYHLLMCNLDMDLIKRRLKFILEIKNDEALSGKQSFKRNSIKGFWAKVCKTIPK